MSLDHQSPRRADLPIERTPVISASPARSTGRALVALAIGAAMISLTGCSIFGRGNKAQTAAPPVDPMGEPYVTETAAPGSATDSSPADVMFQSTEPFSQAAANSVNVFGELDGVGPGPFTVGGRGGFQQHTYVDEGYDADPDVSPDGKTLLFSSTRHSERADLYLQNVDGLAVTQLTLDPGEDVFPRFSPDGKRVAFASNRSGNWDVYVMDVDGNNVQQVTRAPAQEIHPSFSPDGGRLVFSALGSRSGQWELWTIDLRSMERRMIGYGLFADWSPRTDRDVIAFQRARQRGTRWFSAWTLELDAGEARNVTEVAYSTNAAIVAPRWSRDGRRLAFSTIIDPQAAGPASAGARAKATSQDVWTVNADGTGRARLSDGRGLNASPTWSPDGRVYFVSDRGGSEAIWSMSAGRGSRSESTAQSPFRAEAPAARAATSEE